MKYLKTQPAEVSGKQRLAYQGQSASFNVSGEQIVIMARNKSALHKISKELLQMRVSRQKFKEALLIEVQD